MNWWVVHTAAQKEALVDLTLRRKGFITYFPFSHEWQPSPKSKTLSELGKRAFFTRYTFVRCNRENLFIVADTDNVSALVRAPGGDPCPIPEEVMQALVDRLGTGKVFSPKPELRRPKFLRGGVRGRMNEHSPLFGFYVDVVRVLDNYRLIVKFRHALFGSAGRLMEVAESDVDELPPTTNEETGQRVYGSPS